MSHIATPFMYFVSGVPQLLKTVWCCFTNCGTGTCTQYMLNSVFVLPKLSYDSLRYELVYIDYFEKWLSSIRKGEGYLSQNTCANIYISWQTEDFIRSLNSSTEVVIFLLQHNTFS